MAVDHGGGLADVRRREQYRSLVESTSAILWEADAASFQFTYVSPEAASLTGFPVEQWLEPGFWSRQIHPEDRDWAIAYCRQATAARERHSFDYRFVTAVGETLWLRDVVSVLEDEDGRVRLVGVMVDVTALKEAEAAREYVAGLQRELVEISREFVATRSAGLDALINSAIERVGRYCSVDRSYVFRFSADYSTHQCTHEWCAAGIEPQMHEMATVPREALPRLVAEVTAGRAVHLADTAAVDPAWAREGEFFRRNGIESVVVVPVLVAGRVHGEIGFDAVKTSRPWGEEEVHLLRGLADIIGAAIERDQAEAEARQLARRLADTLESITDAVYALDRDWRFTYVNQQAEMMLERKRRDLVGQVMWEQFPEAVGSNIETVYRRVVAEQCAEHFEEYYSPLGRWFEIHAYPSEDGLAVYFRDISERKRAIEEIQFLALYDPLTRLPNRRLLLDRLHQALVARRRGRHNAAVLFLDLDNFKQLNDTLGHVYGDRLLQEVARRLGGCIRASDTVARFGGDEFAIVLCDLDADTERATRQAEDVGRKILDALTGSYQLDEYERHLSVSVGLTLFDDADDTADDLMKRVDLAMYQAKHSGRGTLRIFEPRMRAAMHSRVNLETELRAALRAGSIVPYYQAQVEADRGIVGAEALARWEHPEQGVVSPAEFMAVAEESGLVVPLGEAMLDTVCRRLARWAQASSTAHLRVAVNVSAGQFHHPGFHDTVSAVLRRTGAPPDRLCLELTESVLFSSIADTVARMNRLRALGVVFSLDDFGTGYSSLSSLKQLPLDYLKIDQSFVREALDDRNDAAIVRTIIALADSLGLGVVADGVETEEQRGMLATLGCTQWQGYLFGQPLTAEAFEVFATAARGHA